MNMFILTKCSIILKTFTVNYKLMNLVEVKNKSINWKLKEISYIIQELTRKMNEFEQKSNLSNTDLMIISILDNCGSELFDVSEDILRPVKKEIINEVLRLKSIESRMLLFHGYLSDESPNYYLQQVVEKREAYVYSTHPKAPVYRQYKSILKKAQIYTEALERLGEKLEVIDHNEK